MNFGMIILNQSVKKMENYSAWILIYCFIIHIKTEDVHQDIANDVENWFDTLNYLIKIPLPIEKKLKSSWINERWVSWKNYDRIYKT